MLEFEFPDNSPWEIPVLRTLTITLLACLFIISSTEQIAQDFPVRQHEYVPSKLWSEFELVAAQTHIYRACNALRVDEFAPMYQEVARQSAMHVNWTSSSFLAHFGLHVPSVKAGDEEVRIVRNTVGGFALHILDSGGGVKKAYVVSKEQVGSFDFLWYWKAEVTWPWHRKADPMDHTSVLASWFFNQTFEQCGLTNFVVPMVDAKLNVRVHGATIHDTLTMAASAVGWHVQLHVPQHSHWDNADYQNNALAQLDVSELASTTAMAPNGDVRQAVSEAVINLAAATAATMLPRCRAVVGPSRY